MSSAVISVLRHGTDCTASEFMHSEAFPAQILARYVPRPHRDTRFACDFLFGRVASEARGMVAPATEQRTCIAGLLHRDGGRQRIRFGGLGISCFAIESRHG